MKRGGDSLFFMRSAYLRLERNVSPKATNDTSSAQAESTRAVVPAGEPLSLSLDGDADEDEDSLSEPLVSVLSAVALSLVLL
jgi:hypothetical protein